MRIFPLQRSRTRPPSKTAFTLLWPKTHRHTLVAHLSYPFYSQPVRTHSSMPLWWLAPAEAEEPLTSAQIWLVAKIRPVRRTQILFTITLTRRDLAGLHLCVCEQKTWKEGGRLARSHVYLLQLLYKTANQRQVLSIQPPLLCSVSQSLTIWQVTII